MIAASGLRWILTLAFALSSVHGIWCMVLPGTNIAARVDHALHAAMGVFMIAMAWPWGMDFPAVPQIVLFGAGALWFVTAAPLRRGEDSRGRTLRRALPHAVMMGAMAWMVAAMDVSGSMSGHAGAGSGGDMPGMDMSGGSGLAAMSLTGTGPRTAAALLAAGLAVIGLVWLTRTLDQARGRGLPEGGVEAANEDNGRDNRRGDVSTAGVLASGCHAAMALGMAVMFVLLV
ncbi:DUF5134 domain-containing protein [Streptomyces sp. NPDC051172]|uniref:DUF5134 domain-containing protein n=1 Tax=Streptomyces sp. NPDC051172 TaxID=3155796 RepID=UPI00342301D6